MLCTILFIAVVCVFTGCRYECCTPMDTAQALWPIPPSAMPIKKVEPKKVEEPKKAKEAPKVIDTTKENEKPKPVEKIETEKVDPKPEIKDTPKIEEKPILPTKVETSEAKDKPESIEVKEKIEVNEPPKKTANNEKDDFKAPTVPLPPMMQSIAILKGSFEGAKEAKVGDDFTFTYKVVNEGTKASQDFTTEIILPDGLEWKEDKAKKNWEKKCPPLDGKSTNLQNIEVKAIRAGSYRIQGKIKIEGEVLDDADWKVEIKGEGKLGLKVDAPTLVRMGKDFAYLITLSNDGNGKLEDITLRAQMTGDLYDRSEPPGTFNKKNNRVTWKAGDLQAEQKKEFKIFALSLNKGVFYNKIAAQDASKAHKANAEAITKVEGDIGLQINHYDSEDPVPVGKKTTYVAEVENRGNKAITNFQLVDIIPDDTTFVKAESKISHKVEKNRVIFDVIPAIDPGQTIKFEVTVNVDILGDFVNTLEVTCDGFEKPIRKQEPTKSYPPQG